jgi:hypothetical protein
VRFLSLLTILLLSNLVYGQQNSVKITAKIVDENGNAVPFADVANRRLQLGFSSSKDGVFSTTILKSDSLTILKSGFTPTKINLRDSSLKSEYFLTIVLNKVPLELNEVQINAIRTHQQIRQTINSLYVKNTDVNPDARPMINPLSYLYEMFSKKEKEKRIASKLETEEAKRIVLKDLFRLYNNYNIIDLDEDEYDRFITFLNMPYEYLQRTSDYDLAVAVKRSFAGYSKDKGSSFRKQIYPPALDDMQQIKVGNSDR